MKPVLIWSVTVRTLHFAFAGGLSAALALGFGLDDDHRLFPLHMLAGLFAAGALGLRLVAGLFGGRHARFIDWPMGARAWRQFMGEWFSGGRQSAFAGHNPAAAWVMAGLFVVAAFSVWSGLFGGEDLHEGAAWALVALIAAHLAGLATFAWRHRENIALAMVHGRKSAPEDAALGRPGWLVGLATMTLLATWAAVLWQGYDPAASALRLPGLRTPIQLGEGAERETPHHDRHHNDKNHHD